VQRERSQADNGVTRRCAERPGADCLGLLLLVDLTWLRAGAGPFSLVRKRTQQVS
jgi:hypothetical protein